MSHFVIPACRSTAHPDQNYRRAGFALMCASGLASFVLIGLAVQAFL